MGCLLVGSSGPPGGRSDHRHTSFGERTKVPCLRCVPVSQSYAGPSQLHRLLDAVMAVGSELDLPTMLRTITESARDLADARYAALGVLDEERTHLEQFITE